jgi:subtilase family serine protease
LIAVRARRAGLAVALVCVSCALLASRAEARPVLGLHVPLPCSNPANSGLVGSLLGTARVLVGGQTRCFAQAIGYQHGSLGPKLMAGPVGLGPADIQSAYNLSGLSSGGATVAVVDPFQDPRIGPDLSTFRRTYGLPPCTIGNGCFRRLNQNGAPRPLPRTDFGWAEEESLDVEAVSAACPDCNILLVEARSANITDLKKAEDTAANTPGVVAISNSWGAAEDPSELSADTHFNHPGAVITAASGDSGLGTSWPAASPFVTAVGGTTLTQDSSARGWRESAWSGTGSGCSSFEPKPDWQADTGCPNRTTNDVAADGDPNSGLGVYDTYNSCGSSSLCDTLIELGLAQGLDGWAQIGGTSLSSPLIASVYALAGNTSSVVYGSYSYSHASSLFDIRSGSDGTCDPAYLCQAGPGYDGPTGNGTPNGTDGF